MLIYIILENNMKFTSDYEKGGQDFVLEVPISMLQSREVSSILTYILDSSISRHQLAWLPTEAPVSHSDSRKFQYFIGLDVSQHKNTLALFILQPKRLINHYYIVKLTYQVLTLGHIKYCHI